MPETIQAKIRPINTNHPDPVLIQQAVRLMKQGGVVVFPTTGLYGLGADATNATAIDRIYKIKGRSSAKPILILIKNEHHLNDLVANVPPIAVDIIKEHWPGGVTLVFDARNILPANLTAGTGKVGVRLPAHPVAAALVSESDFPITATSANLAGDDGCATIDKIPFEVIDKVDLVLDAGTLTGRGASTVVDVTGSKPVVLRKGRVSVADIVKH